MWNTYARNAVSFLLSRFIALDVVLFRSLVSLVRLVRLAWFWVLAVGRSRSGSSFPHWCEPISISRRSATACKTSDVSVRFFVAGEGLAIPAYPSLPATCVYSVLVETLPDLRRLFSHRVRCI